METCAFPRACFGCTKKIREGGGILYVPLLLKTTMENQSRRDRDRMRPSRHPPRRVTSASRASLGRSGLFDVHRAALRAAAAPCEKSSRQNKVQQQPSQRTPRRRTQPPRSLS